MHKESRYAFFFQSTDPENDLILIIRYVVSLLISKVRKNRLPSLKRTIAIQVQKRDICHP